MLDNKEEMQENLQEIYELQSEILEKPDRLLLAAILTELQEIKYMLFARFEGNNININWTNTESV